MTTHRSRFALAAVALAVPALAGCSANFEAQTDQVYNPTRGVNDRSGSVDVLHALVVSATEGSGTVVATLVNNTDEADQLLNVTIDGSAANINAAAGSSEIEPHGFVNLGTSGAVTGSGEDIVPGRFVDITFTFETGEAITVEAPVVPNTGDFADVPVKQTR